MSRSVGGKSFKRGKEKKTGNQVGGGEKINFQKKKKIRGKKNWEGGGEKIKLQKKTEIRAEKGQRKKKVNLGWHRDRKENLISASSIHVGPFLDLCMSSLHRGHANFFCIVPILSYFSEETPSTLEENTESCIASCYLQNINWKHATMG